MTALRQPLEPPQRKDAASVMLRLPMPPSVNALWRPTGRRLILSEAYKAWRREAGWRLAQQRPGRVRGPYTLSIIVCRSTKADLGNCEKAISDLLQNFCVIDNDRLAEKITLQWGADEGVTVMVLSTHAAQPEASA